MTPAERLRAAAQLARETAEAATPGPWDVSPQGNVTAPDQRLVASVWVHNATHIALWSPPVALAAVKILEMAADHAAGRGDPCGSCVDAALELADALLQTQPVKP